MPRVTPKPTKAKAKPKRPTGEQIERRRRNVRLAVQAAAVVAAVGGTLLGYNALAAHVADGVAKPIRPLYEVDGQPRFLRVALIDRPGWMTDAIADSVCEDLSKAVAAEPRSRLDAGLLREAHATLKTSPWVREVRTVRRRGDRLLADCVWRRPAAIVYGPGGAFLVADAADEEGEGAVRLPVDYDAAAVRRVVDGNAATDLRVLTGLNAPPPDLPGERVAGEAVERGLEMVALLRDRPEAADVTVVDVAGVARPRLRNTRDGGTSPVVLKTKYGTDLYWGRPPGASDYLVEPDEQQKLAGLGAVRAKYGPAGDYPIWVDLRPDAPLAPRPE